MKVIALLLPLWFGAAIEQVESGGDSKAVSPAGACGMMQITKPTWSDMTEVSWSKRFDPDINRSVGFKYLEWINKRIPANFIGDQRLRLVAAAYNGGITRLRRRGYAINRMPAETQQYVSKVYTLLSVYRKDKSLREAASNRFKKSIQVYEESR